MQELFAGNGVSSVGNDFIDVHIRLCAASGLPHCQRELAAQFSFRDFSAHFRDQSASLLIKFPEPAVGHSRRSFENRESADDLCRHLLCPDTEILITSLCLGAPIAVRRHLHLAH